MKETNKMKCSNIICLLIGGIQSMYQHDKTSDSDGAKYTAVKILNTYKLVIQYIEYSYYQISEIFITEGHTKSVKIVGDFQKKIIKNAWTKINTLIFERHSYFDKKQSFQPLISLIF